MEKTIKKRKWLKYLIIALITVVLLVCMRYVISPIRCCPGEQYYSYENFTRDLEGTEFIIPTYEILPKADGYSFWVTYGENRAYANTGYKLFAGTFSARGLFGEKKEMQIFGEYYSLVPEKQNLGGYEIRCTILNREELLLAEKNFKPNETINGIDVEKIFYRIDYKQKYNELNFIIGDMICSLSLSGDQISVTMQDLEAIAKDLISQYKNKF